MVKLVLMVSTLVCGSKSLSSNLRFHPLKLMSHSSVVEHPAVNRNVASSNLAGTAINFSLLYFIE